MVCYSPIPAVYNIADFKKTGKKKLQLVIKQDTEEKRNLTKFQYPPNVYELIHIPCGKCAGCRSENAKMWATRAYNELKTCTKDYVPWKNKNGCTIQNACFITLTYADDSELVQKDPLCLGDLRYKHFQDFMKRLRKRFPDKKVSYIVCGEYGNVSGRAHWHAILYNFDFEDKELNHLQKGFEHYDSKSLRELWSTYDKKDGVYHPIGHIDLASVDIECCRYVAGYVLKKLPIDSRGFSVGQYMHPDGTLEDIEYADRRTELIRTSRRPAIGKDWYDEFGHNACEKGFIYVPTKNDKMVKVKTPRYYENKFAEECPEKAEELKEKRTEVAKRLFSLKGIDYEELARQQEAHLYRIKKSIKDILTKIIK